MICSIQGIEIGGDTTEEVRFFSKNPELPPADSPFYVAQIGAFVDDQQLSGGRPTIIGQVESEPTLRLGTLHRLGENWGAYADVMSSSEELLLEVGGVLRDRPARYRASVLGTTYQDVGFVVRYNDREDVFGYNFNILQVWAQDDSDPSPETFDPFPTSQTQVSGSVNYLFPKQDMNVGLAGNYTNQETEMSWSVGPTFGMLLYQSGLYDFRLNASATEGSQGFLSLAVVTMSYRDDRWTMIGSAGFRIDTQDDSGFVGSLQASRLDQWDDGRQFQMGAGVFRTVKNTTVSANANYADPLATVEVTVNHSFDDERETTYTGEIEFDLVGNTDGFAITGFGGTDATIIVAIDGEIPEDAQFEIFIDGSKRARLDGPSSEPILLDPYRSYQVSILSNADSLFDYELEAQEITLFPGSVATVTWHVLRILPVFGRVVDENGEPVGRARIEGAHDVASSDADGWFQAQVNGTPALTFVAPGMAPCTVPIGDLPHDAVFYDLGTVVCTR